MGVKYFFSFPEVFEELWLKPVLWLTPLFVWNLFLGKDRLIMFRPKTVKKSVTVGLIVAFVYWLLFGVIAGKEFVFDFEKIGISFAVAVTEELVFSGAIYGRLEKLLGESYLPIFITSVFAVLSRLPILMFKESLNYQLVVAVLVLVFCYSGLNAWIRQMSRNVSGSILARFVLVLITI